MSDEEIIDEILLRAEESKSDAILVKYILKGIVRNPDIKLLRRIVSRMETEGIGKRVAGYSLLWLPLGHEISEKGYMAYIGHEKKEKAGIRENEHITREENEISLSLSQYQFRYTWLPVIAIVISVLSG